MFLVTGSTGFIGSHFVERLRAEDQPYRVTTRSHFEKGEGLEPLLEGVDTVVHLAGVTKALRPADYYAGNARASETLARAIAAVGPGIRMVHVSSLAAAGPSADGSLLAEDAEPRPLTHYGASKLAGEQAVQNILPQAVVVRPPVVYGPRDTGVFRLLKSISRGWVLEIAGGERWFSSIFVDDLVDGLLAAARSAAAAGRVYFLANAKPSTWSELSGIAARIMSKQPHVLRVPLPLARGVGFTVEMWSHLTQRANIVSREKIAEAQCKYWVCDTRRASTELGFEARTSLSAGLSATLAWYREAGWLNY